MMSKMLIGFCGPKGSGKDTACLYLSNKYGFHHKSFASPLKDIVKVMFQLSDHQLHVDKETPDPRWGNITPRKMLQHVGTEWIRNQLGDLIPDIGTNYFVKHFDCWYTQHDNDVSVAISDVRFINEAEYIKSKGGIVVLIQRPGLDDADTHISEREYMSIKPDYIIQNDTFEHLYQQLDYVIQ